MSVDHAALEAIAARVRACTRCPLAAGRTHAVPGEGAGHFGHAPPEATLAGRDPVASEQPAGTADSQAPWSGVLLVGEAPGRNEDETGRPFCGAAGKNLDAGLEAAGLARPSVFITSINICRPPKNRDPTHAEKAACRPFLLEQIEALQPRVIVALGRHGLSGLVEDAPARFTDIRGTFLEARLGRGRGIPVFASLHPAAVIYRRAWREQYLEDWRRLGTWVRQAPAAGQSGKA